MNGCFRRLVNADFNSPLLRRFLSFYYKEGQVYTIPFGPLRGMKMRYDPTVNFHAILGLWDFAFFRFLEKTLVRNQFLTKDSVICDAGANIGVYSLWFARVAPEGIVYSFEPGPDALARLKDSIGLNGLKNVVVEAQACTDRAGTVEFFLGLHHATSSMFLNSAARGIGISSKIAVPATSLDDYFYGSQARPGPNFIKLDIEGAAVHALKACERCIRDKRPFFLIESHNPEEDRAISDLVLGSDYRAYRLTNRQWVKAPGDIHPNPDGVWGTLLLCPGELHASLEKVIG